MGETTSELRRDIDRTRTDMSGTLEAIGDRVSPSRQLEFRKNKMRLWFRDARERVMGAAEDMKDWAEDKKERAGEQADHMADMTGMRPGSNGSPLIAGGLAFGIGALLGATLPSSPREKQMLAEPARKLAEPLKEELKETGSEIADHMKQPVTDAVQEVKQTAQESVSDLKETTRDAAQDVKDAATSGQSETRAVNN